MLLKRVLLALANSVIRVYHIDCKVLDTLAWAERDLLLAYPRCADANVFVHLNSTSQVRECSPPYSFASAVTAVECTAICARALIIFDTLIPTH
jgi:hypothetical protein